MTALDDVRSYYDTNTARFERFGQGGGAIHRAVWGEGVTSREDAFGYIDTLILAELEPLAASATEAPHVLDLGCGVGSSLVFLASRTAIRATGATLSGVQAKRAGERGHEAGLGERVAFIEADFLALPSTLPRAELAFSIEAFVHSPDPGAYFDAAARYLVPGGVLIVCDDFLTERGRGELSRRERRWLHEVRTGWLANSLVTTAEADSLARRAGFQPRKNLDLTPHLELRRPRDRALSVLVALGRHLPLRGFAWRSLVGGNALQLSLGSGLLEFRFLVWQRSDEP